MSKFKAMIGLTVMVGLLAISAAPAMAEWEGKTATGHGEAGPGELTVGSAVVKCTSAEGE
jgi:hypothetical protein